jgi:hypothetical protein
MLFILLYSRFPIVKKADTDLDMKISAIKLPAKENLNQTVSIALIKWTGC